MFGIPDFFSPSFILFLLFSHISLNFTQILQNVVPLRLISLFFLEIQSICFGMLFLISMVPLCLVSYFFLEFQVMPYCPISFWNSRKTFRQCTTFLEQPILQQVIINLIHRGQLRNTLKTLSSFQLLQIHKHNTHIRMSFCCLLFISKKPGALVLHPTIV